MGDYDLSFLYQRRPLGPLIEDPYEREKRAITLADLAQQRDIHALNISNLKRDQEDEDALGKAVSAMTMAGYSPESVRTAIGGAGRAGPKVAKSVAEYQKAQQETEDKKADTEKKKTERLSNAFEHISSVAFYESKKPDMMSLQRIQSVAKTYGVELPAYPGDPRDPEALNKYMKAMGRLSYKAHEQQQDELTADRDAATDARGKATQAETGRHNVATELLGQQTLGETRRHHGVTEQTGKDAAGVGTWRIEGYDDGGKPVWQNTKVPQLVQGAPGQPGMSPYAGAAPISQAELGKRSTGTFNAKKSLSEIATLKQLVADSPNAFSTSAAITASIPGVPEFVENQLNQRQMSAEDRVVRARVMTKAAEIIHDIYGAAQSAGETSRATKFVPGARDDYQTTMVKLRAAEEYAAEKAGELPGGSSGGIRAPNGVGITPRPRK